MPKTFEKDGIIFAVGDQVLLRQGGAEELPYVARIDRIGGKDKKSGFELGVTWFYRPEDVGRRQYHGERELFMSDHKDTVYSACIISKCTVWSLQDYRELDFVTSTDYFWRYVYHTSTRRFSPEQVPVYCSCELPENPDFFMAECDTCLRWFHPHPCEGVDPAEVQATGKFMCRKCRQGTAGGLKVAAVHNIAASETRPAGTAGPAAAPPPRMPAGLPQLLHSGAQTMQSTQTGLVSDSTQPGSLSGAQLQAWANAATNGGTSNFFLPS